VAGQVELALGIELLKEEGGDIETVGDLVAMVVNKTANKIKLERPKSTVGDNKGLREAIQDLAIGAAKAGRAIDLAAAPDILKRHYPTAELATGDIAAELRSAAVRTGAQVSLGRRSQHQ
jgi:hypothetical protein